MYPKSYETTSFELPTISDIEHIRLCPEYYIKSLDSTIDASDVYSLISCAIKGEANLGVYDIRVSLIKAQRLKIIGTPTKPTAEHIERFITKVRLVGIGSNNSLLHNLAIVNVLSKRFEKRYVYNGHKRLITCHRGVVISDKIVEVRGKNCIEVEFEPDSSFSVTLCFHQKTISLIKGFKYLH